MNNRKRKSISQLLMPVVLIWAVLCVSVGIAAVAALTDEKVIEGITITTTDDCTSIKDGVVTVSVSGTDDDNNNCNGDQSSNSNTTIVIKNASNSTATISFDWVATDVNQLTINNATQSGMAGDYSWLLDAGASFEVKITTSNNSTVNTLVMSDFSIVVAQASSTVTLGTYETTLGTAKVGEGSSATGNTTEGVALSAKPVTGATFLAWINAVDLSIISRSADDTYYPAADITVVPVFINSDSNAWFEVDQKYLTDDLDVATEKAKSRIVLMNSGTLQPDSTENGDDGKYTIPTGVTLLVPYDSTNTLVTSGNAVLNAYDTSVTARSEYRSLTMAPDTKITVASGGAISVSSGRANQFIGQVGPYGAIYMENSSNITVQSGGTLYAWGYIFHGEEGSGTVTVASGGTVYEPVSIMDYPGSADLATKLKNANVFPMRSYSLRNVEVPMTLNSGAKEYAFTCLYGSNALVGTNPMYVLLIANETVNGEAPVFQNSGTITKSYVNSRMCMTISGDLELNSLTVKVAKSTGTMEISSGSTSGFYIPSCYDMTLTSGTITLNDNVIMCEGSSLTIDKETTVDANGKNLYVLDADNDPGAVSTSNGCSINVQDVHGNYYTNVPEDAVLDVNGTLIASGGFYTSAAGACITSSEGGGVVQVSGTSASTTVKVKNTNAHTDVDITAAQLLNGNGSYTKTGASSTNPNTYTYIDGYWRCATHTNSDEDKICDACGKECVAEVNETPYFTLKEAVEKANGSLITMIVNSNETGCTITGEVHLDLNGCKVTGVKIDSGGTLYGFDSASDGYNYESTELGAITVTISDGGTVAPAAMNGTKGYVAVADGSDYRFHRFAIMPTAYSFYYNPNEHSHLGFKATVRSSSEAIGKIADIGFTAVGSTPANENSNSTTVTHWYEDDKNLTSAEPLGWSGTKPDENTSWYEQPIYCVLVDLDSSDYETTFQVIAIAAFGQNEEAQITGMAPSAVSLADALAAYVANGEDVLEYDQSVANFINSHPISSEN